MFHIRWFTLCLLLASLTVEPASAQAGALLLFGYGGRSFPLLNLSAGDDDLNSDGDDLSSGAMMGAGLGLQLSPGTALRASITYVGGDYRGSTIDPSDPTIVRTYYGADLMFGSPSDAGFAPYLFFGGGRVMVDPSEPGTDTVGKWAGKSGIGVNYVPDNTFFVLFVEAVGWVYKFNMLGFNKLQLDAGVVGGLAFAIPY